MGKGGTGSHHLTPEAVRKMEGMYFTWPGAGARDGILASAGLSGTAVLSFYGASVGKACKTIG